MKDFELMVCCFATNYGWHFEYQKAVDEETALSARSWNGW
jgi:hypothetical protein